MNKVHILGTMTRDCELKYAQSGTAIGNFGIAYNEKRKDQSGNYVDVPMFFDCTAFGKTAENINKFFHKGSRILLDGSLDFQQWEKDGQKRSKVGIKVYGFDFIDRKSDTQQQNVQPSQQQQYAHGQQLEERTRTAQQVPGTSIPLEIQSDEIPFGYIGLSEGGMYVHLI